MKIMACTLHWFVWCTSVLRTCLLTILTKAAIWKFTEPIIRVHIMPLVFNSLEYTHTHARTYSHMHAHWFSEQEYNSKDPAWFKSWLRSKSLGSKSLMFKYGRMQKETPSWLVCGSRALVTCLHCTLPGVQVTAGLGFSAFTNHLSDNENSDSLFNRPSLLCRSLVGQWTRKGNSSGRTLLYVHT